MRVRLSLNCSAARALSLLTMSPKRRASSAAVRRPAAPAFSSGIRSDPLRPNRRTASAVLLAPSSVLAKASAMRASAWSGLRLTSSAALMPTAPNAARISFEPLAASVRFTDSLRNLSPSCSVLTSASLPAYCNSDSDSTVTPTFCDSLPRLSAASMLDRTKPMRAPADRPAPRPASVLDRLPATRSTSPRLRLTESNAARVWSTAVSVMSARAIRHPSGTGSRERGSRGTCRGRSG